MTKEKNDTVRNRRLIAGLIAVLAALAVAACGSSSSTKTVTATAAASGGGSSSGGSSVGGASTLIGAGSTLVAPLLQGWASTYDTAYKVAITYGPIGSGGGIEQITGRSVNFGASDAPMTSQEAAACKGCIEIPWALAATDVAYHVAGVPNNLKLTGPVLADMFTGKITSWNDPAIKKLNPGVNLPDTKVVPIHRTDGSGDTYAFTNYLSHVDPAFKSKIGAATTVNWPGGLGGKGNSGVGGALQTTNGGIAYIAIAYVLQNKFDYALIQNAAGKYPTPGPASILAAAKAVKTIPSGGTQGISLVDPPASAAGAYPISTFTYVILPKTGSSPAVAAGLKKFISWAITDGQDGVQKLDFAPLPAPVVAADRKTIQLIH
jgi:phosphate transport system substrate-binding protein